MTDELKTVCSWCDTEIIWDPEIGPEEECPHCYNDLGDYRSVNFGLETDGDRDAAESADIGLDRKVDTEDWPDEEVRDSYSVKVEQCIDLQEEAPECSGCRELMLFAGSRSLEKFVPAVPETLGRPFLNPSASLQVYVCPSCFKTETFLSAQDRLDMVRMFNEND
jgi:hypothetical protein